MPPIRSTTCHRRLGILLCLTGFLCTQIISVFAQAQRPPFADAPLAKRARGEEALQVLGNRLREVAAVHRMTEAELRGLFQRDKSLWVDRRGRLFYVCEFDLPPQQGPVGESTNTPPVNPLYQLPQTFKLHSRPGASRVIYLDFDGHDASTTGWGDDNVPMARPYDTDGNVYTFGSTEKQSIQYIWARVAEDFLQYDIDVTTEDPGVVALMNTGTGRYGVRVVIGGDSNDWFGGGAGGVAYLFSFDNDEDLACWVFPKSLSDNEKNIAEACSHEAGHTLGLYHDGQTTGVEYYTGHGNWAPIMGVGYDRPIVQWSSGEYTSANNPEDDLTKMLSYGAIDRPDDHGDDSSVATPLTGVRPFRWGVISSRTDVDYFSFTAGAGRTTITCTPEPRGPNLRIELSLYDSNGSLIISSNVADNATTGVLPVTISLILPTGKYYVSVDGIGTGNPLNTGYSDYASLGQYTLLVTLPGAGTWLPADAGNYVWTNSANWSSGTLPLGPSATAFFNNNLAGDQVVETDMPITLGGLWLGDADATHSFTLQAAGAGSLQFATTNGNAWINKLGGLNDVITAPLQLLTNLAVTNIMPSDLVLAGEITGPFTLTKHGAGRLVLAGTNNGGAGLLIAGGSIQLSQTASVAGVASVSVQTGATLDVSSQPGGWSLSPAQTLSGSGVVTGNVAAASSSRIAPGAAGLPGTLSFSNELVVPAGAILGFNLTSVTNTGGGSNDLIAVAGDLILSGVITVNIDFTGALPDTNGFYTLITYAGTLTGGAANLVAANAGNRFNYTFDDSVSGEVRVQVSGASAALVWQGGAMGNLWDIGGAANWLDSGAPDEFYQGDAVLFDPAGSTAPAVNLSGALAPASVVVSNISPYTFSGSGRLSGEMTLTKQGAGALTLNNSNDFSKAVFVQDGSLVIGNASALGVTNTGTTVSGSGQINLNGHALGNERLTLSGSGPSGDGAVVNTGAAQTNALRLVTLAGDTTLGGLARWDIRGVPASNIVATLTGNGFAVTKTGPNQVWLANLGNTLLGSITVSQGTLGFEGVNTMANTSAPLTVNPGATVAFLNAFDSDFGKVLALNSCTVQNDSGHNNLTGAATISGTITASVGEAATLDLRGTIGGSGGFDKAGPGILRLAGANGFGGNLTITAGTVMAGNNGALGNAVGTTTITSGARLDVAAFNLGGEQIFVAGSGINNRGAIVNSFPTAQQNALRFVTLTDDTTFGGNGRWDIRANPAASLLGAFGLTKVGQNEIWLVNLDTTQLKTVSVNEGTLGFHGTTTMGDAASAMTVNFGGTLGIFATGANILSKLLELNSGRIANGSGSNTFASNVSLSNSNQLDVASGATLVLGGTLSGAGHFGKVSAGTLVLAGNNTSSGASYVNAGALHIGAGGSSGSFAATLNNNGSLVFNRIADLTHATLLSGNGTITKQNTNTLTLSAANNFTGAITVGAGTLRVGNASALGTGVGTTTVADGATLNVNGFNLGAEVVTATGAGVGGNGAVVNTGASQPSALRFLTLAGNTSIGGSARWDLRGIGGGTLSSGSQAWSLTKTGPNTVGVADMTVDVALGNIMVQQGVLSIELNTTGLGNPAATVTIASGAALNLHSLTSALDKAMVIENGGKLSHSGPVSGGVDSTVTGPISLVAGDAYFENSSTLYSLQINGALSGAGNFNKTGAGLVQLNGANGHGGATVISTGDLKLGPASTLSATPVISVAGGAVFDLTSVAGGFVLNVGQVLSGNGAVVGNVIANGAVSPGTSVGQLTILGNATLAGNAMMELGKSGPTLTNDVLSVSGTLTCGGVLAVTHVGNPLVADDSFHLFSAGAMAGAFGNLILPALNPGLAWNTSTLNTDGWLRVTSNTVPVMGSVALNGGEIIISGSGGSPGATYYVLTATDVALPLPQWLSVLTNVFDLSGNFGFTNAIAPGVEHQYFRLHVP